MNEDKETRQSAPQMSMPPVPPTSPDPGKVRPKRKKGVWLAMAFAAVVITGAIFAAVYKF